MVKHVGEKHVSRGQPRPLPRGRAPSVPHFKLAYFLLITRLKNEVCVVNNVIYFNSKTL